MAIFVGSDNNDSKIRDNRVGLAISTSNPSSPDTGDAYYNSTDNKLTVYNGSDWASAGGGGTIDMVASGSLSNGATVVVNTDGTVSVVAQTGSANPSAGTPVTFESGNTHDVSAVYDSTNNKVIIAYADYDNSQYGTAIVGTVSGTSISFGTAAVFESAAVSSIKVTYDSANDKIVIVYQDTGNSNYGTAVVGTVSGTSISFGSAVVFESAYTDYISPVYDVTNEKVVIAYRDKGNSDYGTAIVGTVSGTSISFGSPTVFESANTISSAATYDSTNGKVVIGYKDSGNSGYLTAIVGTVSGTSISFGTPVVFLSADNVYLSAAFDSTNGKVIFAYSDWGNSKYGTAIVGTVSGTSISFGTAVVFESGYAGHISIAHDSTKEKVVIAYRDNGDSGKGKAVVGTVSNTSISFGSPTVFDSGSIITTSSTYDSNNGKVVIAYRDNNSSEGEAVVFSVDTLATNLTSENFIGFSDAAYTNGQTAKIQIEGSVDDAQTGLTTASKHYVQNDGTLSTTAGTPSVVAGIALTDTKILIRK